MQQNKCLLKHVESPGSLFCLFGDICEVLGGSPTDTALYELPTPAFKAMNKYINKKTNYLGFVIIQRVLL